MPSSLLSELGVLLKRAYMPPEEKEHWLVILPVLSDEELSEFKQLLLNDEKKLLELKMKYQKKIDLLSNFD